MERVRDRKEAHKLRGRTYRVTVAAVGVTVILVGLILIPLPGPGWLITAFGVAILALEFDRAERLLERILTRIDDMSDRAAAASPLQKALGALAIAVGAAAIVTVALLWDIPLLPG